MGAGAGVTVLTSTGSTRRVAVAIRSSEVASARLALITTGVAAIAESADGVVVGSAIVELVAQHGAAAAAPVTAYVQSLAAAVAAIAEAREMTA